MNSLVLTFTYIAVCNPSPTRLLQSYSQLIYCQNSLFETSSPIGFILFDIFDIMTMCIDYISNLLKLP